ncbi:MAG TPA: glycosyltransferase family 4 protein [Rubricoccaceae bacterium]|jgi:glycosyltransferase involved in cell wall biosynthesis
MPRVRFVNRVFPPAAGATGLYLAEMADALAAHGWAVDVVTGPAPGAPAVETRPSGVTVRRVGREVEKGRGTVRRALGYAAFFPRALAAAARAPRPDVIVLKTDPPLLATLGPTLRRLTGARIVLWAQDVYPDVAEALGVLPPGGVTARALGRLAAHALRRADAVVAIGRCMAERLESRGARSVTVIPNWAPAGIRVLPRAGNPFRAEHGLGDAFVAMYSGNLGLAHPVGALLDAAGALAETHPEALVVFVGDGPQRAWAEAEVGRRSLANVRFIPFQPAARLAESLGAADVHLVAMEEALAGLVVPSKLYGALAAGRPVVFVGPEASEAARLVREHACGTVVAGSATDALGGAIADALAAWASDPEARLAAGERAARAAPVGPDVSVFSHVLTNT